MDIKEFDITKLEHGTYKKLIESFGAEKIKKRFSFLYCFIDEYIENRGIANKVFISRDLLDNVIIDYFSDIDRIKDFSEIERTNKKKIYAYSAYWLLRRKPIQIKMEYTNDTLSFINEEMVASFVFSFIFEEIDIPIIASQQEVLNEFKKNLTYSFIYRTLSPQAIESIICAFEAGKAFQYSIDYKK